MKYDHSIQDKLGSYETDLYNFNTREEFCKAENRITHNPELKLQHNGTRIKVIP